MEELHSSLVKIGVVREVCLKQAQKAVKSMKNGKSVGPVGIPVEVWKSLKTRVIYNNYRGISSYHLL